MTTTSSKVRSPITAADRDGDVGVVWFKLSPFAYDEMTRLYVDEGLTQKEVADILGTSQQTVGRRLLKLGIEAHSHPCRSIELAPIPDDVNDEDRRKLDYIRGEGVDQKHGEREQADIDLLCDTYRDVLRRYARLEVVSGRP
jgi:hypothetical protein